MLRSTLIALILLTLGGPALAAENDLPTRATLDLSAVTASIPGRQLEAPRRPVAMPVLYVTFAALQIVDAKTTFTALGRGAHETNPVLGRGSSTTVWAVKAASTASTIYFAERLWKKNRVAAVLVMAGINGGYAAVATHNARQAR